MCCGWLDALSNAVYSPLGLYQKTVRSIEINCSSTSIGRTKHSTHRFSQAAEAAMPLRRERAKMLRCYCFRTSFSSGGRRERLVDLVSRDRVSGRAPCTAVALWRRKVSGTINSQTITKSSGAKRPAKAFGPRRECLASRRRSRYKLSPESLSLQGY